MNNGSNWKEIFANSLIYNTSARYKISDNDTNQLSSTIDRSSLKIGDEVEILERDTETTVSSSNLVYVDGVDDSENTLDLEGKPTLNANTKYDVRRKLNKSQFEASSDVLNLYVDKDEYAYVASNSLPSRIESDFQFDNDTVINNKIYRKYSSRTTFQVNLRKIKGKF